MKSLEGNPFDLKSYCHFRGERKLEERRLEERRLEERRFEERREEERREET